MNEVSINNVAFAYPDDPDNLIIENIDLKIEPGEFVCLLGQSGCGKSTLLKLLAGLQKPTSGDIAVDGKVVKEASLDRTVVFQDYGLFPWMTAGENILLGLTQKYPKRNKSELKDIVYAKIEDVGLNKDVYNKLPKELSGGMKQRCAIARSLAIDAPIFLMDEPFGALDAVTRSHLQDLMLELWQQGEVRKTVVFVTHDVDEALLLANRIIILGLSPSKVIYDRKIPDEMRATRQNQFDNPEVLKLRNELVKQINQDVASHADDDELEGNLKGDDEDE